MDVEDYRLSNHQRTFLLHEKGGKEHHVPAHHRLVEYLGEYMDATGLWHSPKSPLFQAVDITKSRLKGTRNEQADRVPDGEATRQAGRLPPSINCHSFRATASPTTPPTAVRSRTHVPSQPTSHPRPHGSTTAPATR